eukprot:4109818-Pleurochrysis_carterae.AAC.1
MHGRNCPQTRLPPSSDQGSIFKHPLPWKSASGRTCSNMCAPRSQAACASGTISPAAVRSQSSRSDLDPE